MIKRNQIYYAPKWGIVIRNAKGLLTKSNKRFRKLGTRIAFGSCRYSGVLQVFTTTLGKLLTYIRE